MTTGSEVINAFPLAWPDLVQPAQGQTLVGYGGVQSREFRETTLPLQETDKVVVYVSTYGTMSSASSENVYVTNCPPSTSGAGTVSAAQWVGFGTQLPTGLGTGGLEAAFYSAFTAADKGLAADADREAVRALEELSAELGQAVSARLRELIALAQDDSPESLPSPQSFRALVDFLVQNRDLKKPGLALDDEGIVWAEWRRAPDCFASLRFLPTGDIRWTIVTPAPMRQSRRVTWRGDGGGDDVRAALTARRQLDWIVCRSG